MSHTMVSDILFLNYLRIAAAVSFYWVVSITTVFVNKSLLSSDGINLNAPFFIIWYQCLITVLICLIIKCLTAKFPLTFSFPEGTPWSSQTVKVIAPLSLLFTMMIAFNSLCLKHVGVSFYYLGRSLTTIFNVILTFLILKERVSLRACSFCFIIAFGFFLGIDQETLSGTFSVAGTVFGLLASFSLAFYSIQTGKVLPYVNKNLWLLSYYNNVYSCIILIPMIIYNGELEQLFKYEGLLNLYFWGLMTVGGICGFAVGYATSLQIKVTSPLTHNISGTAKACAQTVIATFWYQEEKSWLWWLSNWIVLFSSAGYTSVRQKEMREKLEKSRSLI